MSPRTSSRLGQVWVCVTVTLSHRSGRAWVGRRPNEETSSPPTTPTKPHSRKSVNGSEPRWLLGFSRFDVIHVKPLCTLPLVQVVTDLAPNEVP